VENVRFDSKCVFDAADRMRREYETADAAAKRLIGNYAIKMSSPWNRRRRRWRLLPFGGGGWRSWITKLAVNISFSPENPQHPSTSLHHSTFLQWLISRTLYYNRVKIAKESGVVSIYTVQVTHTYVIRLNISQYRYYILFRYFEEITVVGSIYFSC